MRVHDDGLDLAQVFEQLYELELLLTSVVRLKHRV